MLKRFHERVATVGAVLLAEADEDKDNIKFPDVLELVWQKNEKEIIIAEHLPDHQKDELKALFDVYPDVFSDYRGKKTDFIKCKLIRLANKLPIACLTL